MAILHAKDVLNSAAGRWVFMNNVRDVFSCQIHKYWVSNAVEDRVS